MPEWIFPPAEPAALPLLDDSGAAASSFFPVHQVYCVGQNYADHAREMGSSGRNPPFFFAKPAHSVMHAPADGIDWPYPSGSADVQHEVELVVAIGAFSPDMTGSKFNADQAARYIAGYAVGIDFTKRDVQRQLKQQGHPWEAAKSFASCAPVSAINRAHRGQLLDQGSIWLTLDDAPRQTGNLADMIWPVADILAALSQHFVLHPGDLVFTGTPSGVGPVSIGQKLRAGVEGVAEITLTIRA